MKRYILAFDPSGNFNEGKGTTGWCLLDTETDKIAKFGYLSARKYGSQMEYWAAHLDLIDALVGYNPVIVCEDYLLYAEQTQPQINSRMETPKLIGVLQFELWMRGKTVHLQTAATVKARWTDEILANKGFVHLENGKPCMITIKGTYPIVGHTMDAIRHAVHFSRFRLHRLKEDNHDNNEEATEET